MTERKTSTGASPEEGSLGERLLLHIPSRPSSSSSSADSPLNGSPSTSILTLSSSAQCSPGTAQNVKFAPLPDISRRKKRYHQPLGVAARSELMRKRRENGGSDSVRQWDDGRRYRRQRTVMGDEDEDEDTEDPFLTLGRMVKGASKSLWKKMAPKQAGEDEEKGGRDIQDDTVVEEQDLEYEDATPENLRTTCPAESR